MLDKAPAAYTKFTEERRNLILEGLRNGLTRGWAAKKARISPDTLRLWTRRGEQDIANGEETDYAKFVTDMDVAQAELLESFTKDMTSGDKHDKKWIITHLYARDGYSDVQKVEVEAKVETTYSWKDIVEKAEQEE